MRTSLMLFVVMATSLAHGQAGLPRPVNYQEGRRICQAPSDTGPSLTAPSCPLYQEIAKERRLLEAVRITRMTEALKLSDEQIAQFIPRLKRIEERQRQLRRERTQRIQRLAETLERKFQEKELRAQLDSLEKLEREEMQKTRQMMQGLDSLLTLEQRARWRIFNEQFEEEVRKMVRDIHRKRMDHRSSKGW